MIKKLLVLTGVILLMTLPALAQVDPEHENVTSSGTFTAVNPCNGDFVAGTYVAHFVANIVQPETPLYTGTIQMVQDKFRGTGVGQPSGLTYKLFASPSPGNPNYYDNYHFNPGNGAIILADNSYFRSDPIGNGSKGLEFRSRVFQHQLYTYADGWSSATWNLHIWPAGCYNEANAAGPLFDFDETFTPEGN